MTLSLTPGTPFAATALWCATCVGATAQEAPRKVYNLPAGDAAATLKQFAADSGEQIVYLVDNVRGERTKQVSGEFAAREALELMLLGTRLVARQDEKTGALVVGRRQSSDPNSHINSRSKPETRKNPQNSMKKNPISMLSGWLALLLMPAATVKSEDNQPASSAVQQSTTLLGYVRNAATGRTLPGARVELQGQNRSAIVDNEGQYYFSGVTPGPVTLSVSYTGLDTQVVPVTIGALTTNRQDIDLTADIYRMSKFVVSGEREGNAEAITRQRYSTGVRNVVSTDAFGTVAGNPADLLMRLPGVEAESVGGDRRYVRIRGMHQNLNTVTMDGSRVASAGSADTNRTFEFQSVGSDTIERIEVVKSPTPDMDADSIGGAVNMVSKSAFDRSGERRITGSIGGIWRAFDPRDKVRETYSVSYSEVFNGKIGISVNYAHREHGSMGDVISQGHETLPDTVRGPAYTNFLQTYDFRSLRAGWGGGLRVDYKHSEHTRFSINTTMDKYLEDASHVIATYSTAASVATLDPSGQPTGTGAILPGYTEDTTQWRPVPQSVLTQNAFQFFRRNHRFHTQVSGNHRYPGLEINWDAYKSNSKSEYPGYKTFDLITRGIGIRVERKDEPFYPSITQTAGPDITQIGSYLENNYGIGRLSGWDEGLGQTLHVKKSIDTIVPAYIKAGLRLRQQTRQTVNTSYQGKYVGPDGVMGVNPATGINDDNLAQFVDPVYRQPNTNLSRYPKLPTPTQPERSMYGYNGFNIATAFQNTPQYFQDNVTYNTQTPLTGAMNFKEDISAAYVLGNVELGRLTIMGGVRVEETKDEAEGALNAITPEEQALRAAWVGPVTDAEARRRVIAQFGRRSSNSGENRVVFPGLHFKYEPVRGLITRLSYATNIGRPNIGQLIPNTSVNHDNLTVSTSNPNLKPQYADNFDLSAEYYFEPAGLVSAGVFLKEIKSFIYTQSGLVVGSGANNGFDGEYAGYTLTTQLNGGFAKVKGLELNYNQQFTFLPGWWSGFGAFANYTRLDIEGNYSAGSAIALAPTSEIPGFNPEIANVGVSYIKHRASVRLQWNHYGRFLAAFSTNKSLLQYYKARDVIDVKLGYQISKHFDAYLDVVNLFSEADRAAESYSGRPRSVQQLGTQIFFGINGRM